jgi:hypothetical protein
VSNDGVAAVVWFFTADPWSLALSDGCFVVTAPMADTLLSMSFRSPHLGKCFAAKCVMAPLPQMLCRWPLADALSSMSLRPPHLGSFVAKCMMAPLPRMFFRWPLADALPPYYWSLLLGPMLCRRCLLGGCFTTTASPHLLVPFALLYSFLQGQFGYVCVRGFSLPHFFSFLL